MIFTVVYQWAWIAKFLDVAQLPLAAGIFLVFGIAAATALWIRARRQDSRRIFDRIGQLGAALPLLFALFAAAVPAYGARFNVLFGFLLLMAAGLGVIAMLRGIEWLHALGVVATVLTFAIWLAVSYTPAAWPAIARVGRARSSSSTSPSERAIARASSSAAPRSSSCIPALVQLEPRTASPVLLFSVLFVLLALAAAYAIALRGRAGLLRRRVLRDRRRGVVVGEASERGAAVRRAGDLRRLRTALPRRPGARATLQPRAAAGERRRRDGASSAWRCCCSSRPTRIAPGALWGLALLLAVLLIGAMTQARFTRRPLLAAIAVVLAWIVLASWWEAASLEAALIPALFVIAVFGVLVVLDDAWARFEGQTHLALGGHAFLIFVAASRTLAFPPWPFLAVLLVLDLAIGVAALYLKRSLAARRRGGDVAGRAAGVDAITDLAPWPNVALAATLGVAAYAICSGRRSSDAGRARYRPCVAIAALFLGHIVAIVAGHERRRAALRDAARDARGARHRDAGRWPRSPRCTSSRC